MFTEYEMTTYKMSAPMLSSQEDRIAAIRLINDRFGNDLKSLSDLKSFYNEVKEKVCSLESRLALANNEIPREVESAINNAKKTQRTIQSLQDRSDTLRHKVLDHTRDLTPLVKDVTPLSEQITDLQKYRQYLSCVTHIDNISSNIHDALIAGTTSVAVDEFCCMTEYYTQIQSSNCQHLLQFFQDTIQFWHRILKEKLSSLLEESFKAVGWPLIATSIKSTQTPSDPAVSMETIFTQLLQLQLPDALNVGAQKKSLNLLSEEIPFKPLVLPIQLMVNPIRKRFKYHFCGKKQTNQYDKPEWYLGQVLNWIRDHTSFLEQRIQPLLNNAGLAGVDVKVDFMRGLVALVMEKMASDIPSLLEDEHLFSHLVDEAIFFDHELHNSYGYPAGLPSSMNVLTIPQVFDRWINIEKKFAVEKMDAMLSSATAWQSQYKDIADVDTLKVPECGESFITLMSTITDRYKYLPSATHRVNFLHMQLELLEDFRIRLVQVMKEVTHDPLGDIFCAILNAVHYITEVLREWSNMAFFVELQYSCATLESHDTELTSEMESTCYTADATVFDDAVDMYEKLKSEMQKNILNHIFVDTQARSQPYRKERWLSLSFNKDIVSQSLSTSACEMLMVLKDHLTSAQSQLSKPLFTFIWQKLAEKLSKFMLNEVVLMNRFNDGGALQLEYDMTRNLFPMFGEFTNKPHNYFREIKEACVLLNLKVGSGLLLKEVLTTDQSKTQVDQALHEVGIYKLKPQVALNVLNSRTNLSVT